MPASSRKSSAPTDSSSNSRITDSRTRFESTATSLHSPETQGLPLVATNDVHYCQQEDAPAQEILVCIQTNTTLNDPKRLKSESDQLFLKSPEEMARVFARCSGGDIEHDPNRRDVLARSWISGYHLPNFPFHRGLPRIPILNRSARKESSDDTGTFR